MYVRGRLRIRAALLGLIALLTAGCEPVLPEARDALLASLSQIVLGPEVTCEDLQSDFGVTDLLIAETPTDAGLEYEEHFLITDEGFLLRVWYMPSKLDLGVVIQSNGAAAEMACYLFAPQNLVRAGWSVVLYEYQGFGLSTGPPSLAKLAPDLELVLDWTLARTQREQATLYGVSLGGVPTIAVAVDRADGVNGVILDSPASLASELRRFGLLLGGEPGRFVNRLDRDLLSDRLALRMKQPLLMYLHGKDALTVPSSVRRLFRRAAGPKALIRFPELGHARGMFYATARYFRAMEGFLQGLWIPDGDPFETLSRDPNAIIQPALRDR